MQAHTPITTSTTSTSSTTTTDLSAFNFHLHLPNVEQQYQQYQSFVSDWNVFLTNDKYLSNLVSAYQSIADALASKMSSVSLSPMVLQGTIIVLTTIIIQSMMNPFRNMGPDVPYPKGRYDPVSAKTYFDRRPGLVASRGLQVLVQSLQFAIATILVPALFSQQPQHQEQQQQKQEEEEEQGRQLAQLLCRLGSTYIKVGQSLSIRTDLLSPPYIRGLQTLQDQVPPFDSQQAFDMIEEEWGASLDTVVTDITPLPIASASLGQVYKATLLRKPQQQTYDNNNNNDDTDNSFELQQEVAIKIQRPNIMETIALDMYLLREYVAPAVKKIGNLNSDTIGTVDAWGLGFVDELDYIREAKNSEFFSEKIAATPLQNVVFAPKVISEYSTNKVLVTEWVDGERLDKSSQEDVNKLCSIAMNTYLTMLLEIGMLHCDPQ